MIIIFSVENNSQNIQLEFTKRSTFLRDHISLLLNETYITKQAKQLQYGSSKVSDPHPFHADINPDPDIGF